MTERFFTPLRLMTLTLMLSVCNSSCSEVPSSSEDADIWKDQCVSDLDGMAMEYIDSEFGLRQYCVFSNQVVMGLEGDGSGGSRSACQGMSQVPYFHDLEGSSLAVCSNQNTPPPQRDHERIFDELKDSRFAPQIGEPIVVSNNSPQECPDGLDGDYCRGGDLYTCTTGIYTFKQECLQDCLSMNAGADVCTTTPDPCEGVICEHCTSCLSGSCVADPAQLGLSCGEGGVCSSLGVCIAPSCPSGNGDYCQGGDLYVCNNGTYTLKELCGAAGCTVMPPGMHDECDEDVETCQLGEVGLESCAPPSLPIYCNPGSKSRTCDPSGQWGSWSMCEPVAPLMADGVRSCGADALVCLEVDELPVSGAFNVTLTKADATTFVNDINPTLIVGGQRINLGCQVGSAGQTSVNVGLPVSELGQVPFSNYVLVDVEIESPCGSLTAYSNTNQSAKIARCLP